MMLSQGKSVVMVTVLLAVSACSLWSAAPSSPKDREVLLIYPDGSMKLDDRYIPEEDVVIYPDGFGGERAAIKVRIEPLHPDFYRDTIVVKRVGAEESDSVVAD